MVICVGNEFINCEAITRVVFNDNKEKNITFTKVVFKTVSDKYQSLTAETTLVPIEKRRAIAAKMMFSSDIENFCDDYIIDEKGIEDLVSCYKK